MKNVTEGLEFLYRLVEHFPDGIIVFDIEGKVTLLNRVAFKQMEAKGSLSEYIEQPVLNLLGNSPLADKVRSCITDGRTDFEFEALKINSLYLDIYGKKITEGMLLFLYDITHNIKAKNLTLNTLIQGQELERQRIAKEIHDGIGPSLSTIRLGIDMVSTIAEKEKIKNKLNTLSSQVAEIAEDIRNISHDLMPSSLLDFGIKSALENLVAKIEENSQVNIEKNIQIKDEHPFMDQNQTLNIYRITQESIHNGLKHGNANEFTISLSEKNETFHLKIVDNGKSEKSQHKAGIGLKNMQARVNSMNGTISTKILKPNGFEVYVKIPYKN